MWKKSLFVLIVIVLGLSLAACGNTQNNANNSGANDSSENAVSEDGIHTVVIKGRNFEFDQEEYTVPVGEPVKLVYRDEQGAHGIYVEGVKVRLRNKEETTVTFTEPGTYEVICSIYCGPGHAKMKSVIVAQ